MNLRTKVALAACLPGALLLGGCAVFTVTKYNAADAQPKGIPFLVKVPVQVHTTKYARRGLQVHFEIRSGDPAKPTVESIPPGPAPWFLASTEIQGTLHDFQHESLGSREEALRKINALFAELGKESDTAELVDADRVLVANTCAITSGIGAQMYAIQTKRPFIGSATFEVDIAEDGTMSKSHAEVTDKTVETLASVIPVAGFLTAQWGIAAAATGAAHLTSGTPTPRPAETVDLYVVPVRIIYELRQQSDASSGGFPSCSAQLSYSSVKDGTVELVSRGIETAPVPPDDDPKKGTNRGDADSTDDSDPKKKGS